MSTTNRIIEGFKATLVADVVRIAAKGILIVLLARVFLTPEEYGLLFLAISIFGFAILFSRLGLANSAARYVAEYRETDPSQVPHLVRTSLLYIGVLMLVVASALAILHRPIAAQFGEPQLEPLLLIGFLYIVVKTLNSYLHTLFQGFNRVTWSAKVTIASNAGIFTFVVAALALEFGVVGALLGYVAGYATGGVVGLILLWRLLSEFDPAFEMEPGLRRRLLEYSVPLAATKGANTLYKRVDTILVGFFLTPVAVGFYELAKQISEFVIAPANALGFAVSPTYGEQKANGNLRRAAQIYETTFAYNVLFYVPAAAGLVLVAEPAIRFVFGTEYLGAVPIVQVFAAFIVLQSIDKMTNDALDYLGRAKHRAIVKGGTGILNFGLNLALIPTIGVVGAAVSTVASYSVMVVVNVYLIHSELQLSISNLIQSIVPVVGITIIMSATVYVLLPLVTNLIALLGVVALGGLVWMLISVSTGMLDPRQVMTELR